MAKFKSKSHAGTAVARPAVSVEVSIGNTLNKYRDSLRFTFPKFSKRLAIDDIQSFFEKVGVCDSIKCISQLNYPNEWQVQTQCNEAREKLIRLGRVEINKHSCRISPLCKDEVRGFIHWLPVTVDSRILVNMLREYGEVLFFENERYHWNNKQCKISKYFGLFMKPNRSAEEIPHFVRLGFVGLVTIKGRDAACFLCKKVGHRRRDCPRSKHSKFLQRQRKKQLKKNGGIPETGLAEDVIKPDEVAINQEDSAITHELEAIKPVEEVNKPAESAIKTEEGAMKLEEEAIRSAEEGVKSQEVEEAVKSATGIIKMTEEAIKSADEVSKSVEGGIESAKEVAKPTEEAAVECAEACEPEASVKKKRKKYRKKKGESKQDKCTQSNLVELLGDQYHDTLSGFAEIIRQSIMLNGNEKLKVDENVISEAAVNDVVNNLGNAMIIALNSPAALLRDKK